MYRGLALIHSFAGKLRSPITHTSKKQRYVLVQSVYMHRLEEHHLSASSSPFTLEASDSHTIYPTTTTHKRQIPSAVRGHPRTRGSGPNRGHIHRWTLTDLRQPCNAAWVASAVTKNGIASPRFAATQYPARRVGVPLSLPLDHRACRSGGQQTTAQKALILGVPFDSMHTPDSPVACLPTSCGSVHHARHGGCISLHAMHQRP